MKYSTKFKYNDKVKIINTNIHGELIDILPIGIVNGIPIYRYKMFTINKGFLMVEESVLEIL